MAKPETHWHQLKLSEDILDLLFPPKKNFEATVPAFSPKPYLYRPFVALTCLLHLI